MLQTSTLSRLTCFFFSFKVSKQNVFCKVICKVQFVRGFDMWSVKCIYFSNVDDLCLMQKMKEGTVF